RNRRLRLPPVKFQTQSSFPGWPHSDALATSRPRLAFSFGLLHLVLLFIAIPVQSQVSPYVVTYDHYLEEPGSLELEYFSTFGTRRAGNDCRASWTEFEYGATAWWPTEVHLDGQTTIDDSTLFSGFRGET